MENTVNEKDLHTQDELNEEIDSNLDAVKDELEREKNCDNESEAEGNSSGSTSNELEDYKNRYTRLSADFQNYKKRIEKEKSEIFKFGSEKIVVDILPIIDNFERAIDASKNNNKESDGLLDGIEMIFKQFVDALKKHGVEEIESLDKEFDPNLHHAVMQEECEGVEENTVTAVFQKGYTLNSKVIRPSMVKVSK